MLPSGNTVTDAQLEQIPGWFQDYDADLFRFLLDETSDALEGGDLAEIGVYLGKSAALIGGSVGAHETFTVIDLFGAAAGTADNRSENSDQYDGLTRESFERYYRLVHPELPVVIVAPSSTIVDHAGHGTHRFVHVDASHTYERVVEDVASARTLLKPDGIVVFDDYRSEHTPGVAAAVWEAVGSGLHPFALSPVKMYATFGDASSWYARTASWAVDSRWESETQRIAGHDVLRLWWAPSSERTPSTGLGRRDVLRRGVSRARRMLSRA